LGSAGKCWGIKQKKIEIDLMEALAFVLLWIKREKRKKKILTSPHPTLSRRVERVDEEKRI
jgi:hypothetical protein